METGQQIEWQDLDKRRYYIIGPSMFVCVRAVLYPINLIKVHLFMQQGNSLYSGAIDAFRKILRREGIRGLYRGFTVSLLGMASGQMYITTYELTRSRLPGYSTEFKGLVAGTCATVIGQLLTVPVDIVSQHMMMEGQGKWSQKATSRAKPSQYILVKNTDYVLPKKQKVVRSAYHIVSEIVHREGFQGLHKGYSVSLLTYAPNSALFWSNYSMLFRWCMESGLGEALPLPLVQASCGVVGGVTSAALTNPLDVLRTRYQVSPSAEVARNYDNHTKA
ncbi:Solute carrier family 25 member 44 [Geodia barretti]|uniref:Solute carrier family 25 member 44 n=1 Tax=Geodia barretti TaxID=519541 RepID=A0AA35RLF5_GEOBA|nr:Solute carrier family 25 member 44 [Geodia barretti]